MVTTLAWLLMVVMVAIPLLQVTTCLRKRKPGERQRTTMADYQVMHDLYAIRRRFDVAWFKVGLRRDTADAQRALRAELYRLEKRERP